MKIYDDLLEHIRRRIQLHEIAGDFSIATESLKIYLDEWEERSKLHQPTVKSLVCEHEWKADQFDCYGNATQMYCDDCGAVQTNL
jgi:hypothetical protein